MTTEIKNLLFEIEDKYILDQISNHYKITGCNLEDIPEETLHEINRNLQRSDNSNISFCGHKNFINLLIYKYTTNTFPEEIKELNDLLIISLKTESYDMILLLILFILVKSASYCSESTPIPSLKNSFGM